MKVVVFGIDSPFSIGLLRSIGPEVSHLLVQGESIKSIQRSIMQVGLSCPIEIIDGDLNQPCENYMEQFSDRLSRLEKVDLIISSLGVWQSHCPVVNTDLTMHFKQWQVNYFFPISMLQNLVAYTHKKTTLVHNNSDKALPDYSLQSLNKPSCEAYNTFLKALAAEHKWTLMHANLGLYQSRQSGKVFTDLPSIESLEEFNHFTSKLTLQIENHLKVMILP